MLIYAIWYYFLIPPSGFPKNIPTIPFYVTLLSLVKDVDQTKLYGEYFEQPLAGSGAVKTWWGSRWSILVERAEYLRELIKHVDVYTKSGNYAKNPHSVIGEYMPEDIITTHGEPLRSTAISSSPLCSVSLTLSLFWGMPSSSLVSFVMLQTKPMVGALMWSRFFKDMLWQICVKGSSQQT